MKGKTMASIRKEILIEADCEEVWAAARDIGALHERLASGFVVDTRMEGDDRIVTFANGLVAREAIVAIDDAARRLAWTVVGGRTSHYNASFQAFADGEGRTRAVWIVDLLPDELAGPIGAMVEQGSAAIKRTLERPRAHA
jgi:Polyketide cyclase / dehydrase and lipid transport